MPHFKAGKELRERVDTGEYRIDGFYIVDTSKPSMKIYIHEILDSESAEFNRSKLTNQQKLAIISKVGLKPLTTVLDAYYRSCNKSYNAADEAQRTCSILNNL